MNKALVLVSLGLVFTSGPGFSQDADEAAAACTEAARLIEESDFTGALDEAKWCVESLEQLKQQSVLLVFPDEIQGYSAGNLENQSAMGMTIIERDYSSDAGTANVSLTTGIAGGGLAALAQLGLGSGGGKKLRIQKRTVVDMSNESESQFMVQLKNGGMLSITSSSLSKDELLNFTKAFPIQQLDEALAP